MKPWDKQPESAKENKKKSKTVKTYPKSANYTLAAILFPLALQCYRLDHIATVSAN